MTRWLGILIVVAWVSVTAWGLVEAKDRSVAKSLARTGPVIGGYARPCRGGDLPGNWRLVTFDSPYRFRNPQAPYLLPHQVFHYSNQGGTKSAHSLRPILALSDKIFETIPLEMTYRVRRGGLVVLKKHGHEETVESWTCTVITEDHDEAGGRIFVKRGDLLMTLRGTEGQALFVRHLRKDAA
jgi:hypothetical protein